MSKLTKEQELEIIKKYKKGYKTKELCLQYGYSLNNRHGILNILKKYKIAIRPDNLTNKKWNININYFEKVDTEGKAYFLGLLYADGYNSLDKKCIRLQLQEDDEHILLEFNEQLNYNKPLGVTIPKEKNRKTLLSLDIYNKKMSLDLKNLGCMQAKTHLLKFPTEKQVPKHLVRHFIRGYFDGDGSIVIKNKTYSKRYKSKFHKIPQTTISMVGNLEFILEVQKYLINNLNFNKTKLIVRHKDRTNNIVSLRYGGNKQNKKFYNHFYTNSNFFFERKYLRFKGVFEQ